MSGIIKPQIIYVVFKGLPRLLPKQRAEVGGRKPHVGGRPLQRDAAAEVL